MSLCDLITRVIRKNMKMIHKIMMVKISRFYVCLNVYCRLVVHIKLQVILKITLCKYYQYHREINYIEIK